LKYYIGFGLQILGFAAVGLCLFSGISMGDYGRLELAQFVGGSAAFYIGNIIRGRGASN
jgi:hypothetical protein